MRIISGRWRSRRLVRPNSTDTRPLPDRVKESLFNILGARFGCPGEFPSIYVADVFSGSGSIGLEALSRGASHCWFFENGRIALQALRRNIEALQAGPVATVVASDAWRCTITGGDGPQIELVFLDPPYRDSSDSSATGSISRYLGRLGEAIDPAPLVVLHHEAKVIFESGVCAGWTVARTRTIGSNTLTFFEK